MSILKDKPELTAIGYAQSHEEIRMWIGFREGTLTEAWETFKYLVVGLVVQAASLLVVTLPFPLVTYIGLALPIYIYVLALRWNRFNTKIGEQSGFRMFVEGDDYIGQESYGTTHPPTGVANQAKNEFRIIVYSCLIAATLVWLFTSFAYYWWVNVATVILVILVARWSKSFIGSIKHIRIRAL